MALVEFDGRVHRSVCSVDVRFMWIQKAESLVYFSIGIRAPIQITNERIQNDVETFDFEPFLSQKDCWLQTVIMYTSRSTGSSDLEISLARRVADGRHGIESFLVVVAEIFPLND